MKQPLFIILALVLILAGCGGKPEEAPQPTPTRRPVPTFTSTPPKPTATPAPPTATPLPPLLGTIDVDNWRFDIYEIKADPGLDAGRQSIILLGYLTNVGRETDTFSATYRFKLQDGQGRLYEEEDKISYAAEGKYGAEIPASISPEAKVYAAVGFDAPATEKSFTIIPGDLASSWGKNFSFTLQSP